VEHVPQFGVQTQKNKVVPVFSHFRAINEISRLESPVFFAPSMFKVLKVSLKKKPLLLLLVVQRVCKYLAAMGKYRGRHFSLKKNSPWKRLSTTP
jgi:hypothetical protein